MWLFSYSLLFYKDTVEVVTAGAGEVLIHPYRDPRPVFLWPLPVAGGGREGKTPKPL